MHVNMLVQLKLTYVEFLEVQLTLMWLGIDLLLYLSQLVPEWGKCSTHK